MGRWHKDSLVDIAKMNGQPPGEAQTSTPADALHEAARLGDFQSSDDRLQQILTTSGWRSLQRHTKVSCRGRGQKLQPGNTYHSACHVDSHSHSLGATNGRIDLQRTPDCGTSARGCRDDLLLAGMKMKGQPTSKGRTNGARWSFCRSAISSMPYTDIMPPAMMTIKIWRNLP